MPAISLAGLLMAARLLGGPAQPTDPTLYFCYAPMPGAKLILAGPVQPVGPKPERNSYPKAFAVKLAAAGLLGSDDDQVYCVMRATQREIDKARESLAEWCPIDDDGTMSPLCGTKWTVKDVLAPTPGARRPLSSR